MKKKKERKKGRLISQFCFSDTVCDDLVLIETAKRAVITSAVNRLLDLPLHS